MRYTYQKKNPYKEILLEDQGKRLNLLVVILFYKINKIKLPSTIPFCIFSDPENKSREHWRTNQKETVGNAHGFITHFVNSYVVMHSNHIFLKKDVF